MPADDKTLARIKKLLALAAPDSGTTQSERESAAVEAAKLIAQHGVSVGAEPKIEVKTRVVYRDRQRVAEVPPPGPTRMRTPFGQEYTVRYHWTDWRQGVASGYGTCCDPSCNGRVAPGDRVWQREKGGRMEYLHADGICHW